MTTWLQTWLQDISLTLTSLATPSSFLSGPKLALAITLKQSSNIFEFKMGFLCNSTATEKLRICISASIMYEFYTLKLTISFHTQHYFATVITPLS